MCAHPSSDDEIDDNNRYRFERAPKRRRRRPPPDTNHYIISGHFSAVRSNERGSHSSRANAAAAARQEAEHARTSVRLHLFHWIHFKPNQCERALTRSKARARARPPV